MTETDFLILIIGILTLAILGATWLFLASIIKNLQHISDELQNTINNLEDWKRKWIY